MGELLEDIMTVGAGAPEGARSRSLCERARRYASLAALFRPRSKVRSQALCGLSDTCRWRGTACPFPELVPVQPQQPVELIEGDSLEREYDRLFGTHAGFFRTPVLSPLAGTRLAPAGRTLARVQEQYAAWGYPRDSAGADGLPADHVSVELDFVAHCLLLASHDVRGALEAAQAFHLCELQPWLPLFAASAISTTRHPTMRFAARTLETFLACERLTFISDGSDVW